MTLKQIRLKSGLKVNKIAEELGMTRFGYYNIEIGKTKPTIEQLDVLSKLFKTEILEISKLTGVRSERASKEATRQ